MTNRDFQPIPIMHLACEEEMRAYAHPARMAILAMLAREPLTLSLTAARLGVHPANLSRHFKTLERAGLILLVETRDTGRNLEKYYRAAALSYLPELEGLSPLGKRELALTALRDEVNLALQRLQAERAEGGSGPDLAVYLRTARLRPKDRGLFYARFEALLKEFAERDSADGDAYTLGLSLFPASRHSEGVQELRITEGKKKP